MIPIFATFMIVVYLYFIREFKRIVKMESVTNSSLITKLGETITGAMTIRAFQKTQMFRSENFKLQDKNLGWVVLNKGLRAWFNIRINLLIQVLTFG